MIAFLRGFLNGWWKAFVGLSVGVRVVVCLGEEGAARVAWGKKDGGCLVGRGRRGGRVEDDMLLELVGSNGGGEGRGIWLHTESLGSSAGGGLVSSDCWDIAMGE